MRESGFSDVSREYEGTSIIQRGASEILFELLSIQPHEDVLDLGCGPGHLTQKIKEMTNGIVMGLDPSEGMIRQAKEKYDIPINEEYRKRFLETVEQSFKEQAKEGMIDLTFNRIFLIAEK